MSQEVVYDMCAKDIVNSFMEGYSGNFILILKEQLCVMDKQGLVKHLQWLVVQAIINIEEWFQGLFIIIKMICNKFNRVINQVYQDIETRYDQYITVKISYLEIYNEEIRDLLAKNPRNRLDLHEKPDSGVYVRDLSYFAVKSV